MSHHIDSDAALQDGRLDLCDLFVFEGEQPQTTVLILTVNPLAGVQSPSTFHPEGLYEFRIDTNGDAIEDFTLRLTFGTPNSAGVQEFELQRCEGISARSGCTGKRLALGCTETTVAMAGGGRIRIGLAADPFYGNGEGLDRFFQALAENRFDRDAFASGGNFYHNQNVSSIVLELPNSAFTSEPIMGRLGFGADRIGVWATTALWHNQQRYQINRAATPQLLHLFLPEDRLRLAFNQGRPQDDLRRTGAALATFVTRVTRLAQSSDDPVAYGRQIARTLLPDMLTYRLGTAAHYSATERNGRHLADDGFDAALALLTNLPLNDGVRDEGRHQAAFPYLVPPIH